MRSEVKIEPLREPHLEGLIDILWCPEVYAHIASSMPERGAAIEFLRRSLRGPGSAHEGEQWLNFLIRNNAGSMVGRLEATVHHGIAEVAFLLGPEYWGRGYASQSLQWLHAYLAENLALGQCWAVTAPTNWRCQKLLLRNGYCEQLPPEFPLYSYDPGDKIYSLKM